MSEAAPYRHFEDKQALVAAIAQVGFEQLTTRLQTTSEQAPDEVRSKLLCLARAGSAA